MVFSYSCRKESWKDPWNGSTSCPFFHDSGTTYLWTSKPQRYSPRSTAYLTDCLWSNFFLYFLLSASSVACPLCCPCCSYLFFSKVDSTRYRPIIIGGVLTWLLISNHLSIVTSHLLMLFTKPIAHKRVTNLMYRFLLFVSSSFFSIPSIDGFFLKVMLTRVMCFVNIMYPIRLLLPPLFPLFAPLYWLVTIWIHFTASFAKFLFTIPDTSHASLALLC